MTKYLNKPSEGKGKLVFCKAYRNRWTGKLMVASEYGYKAWAFYVRDDDIAS